MATGIATIAEDLFFRDAASVETSGVVPEQHFEALAAAGLYGAFAPSDLGGASLEMPEVYDAIETLAAGCLASTFVWIQHFGILGTLLDPATPTALREPYLAGVIKGEIRCGIALTAVLPGPPQLRAHRIDGGWRIDGTAPWVTGWNYIDLVLVAARADDDDVVFFILEADDAPGLVVTREHLVAADASFTVKLDFDGLVVPDDRVSAVVDYEEIRASLGPGSARINASLALGITNRCCRIVGPSPLDEQLDRCRDALNKAGTDEMPAARAAASALATQAAAALTVARGSSSMRIEDHASRLWREAAFVLVFASRPEIKAALRDRFTTDRAV